NGVWYGPSTNEEDYRWYSSGHYPYTSIMGGDGMQIAIDTRDNNIVYTGYQFGNYFRINKSNNEYKRITPRHNLGERPLRFNWQTPIHLSVHNQDILYIGSNNLHRSLDKGETFETLSGDLTNGGKKGDVPYGTLTTIDESPLKFGLLYVGSDDGLVHVSKDAGHSWQKISDELPQDYWISRVEASHHDTGTVYVSLNGYRWDNFDAILYASSNYGDSWTRIGTDLPNEPINVVKEDPANENILYAGTDHGLYASLDKGSSFMALYKNLPAAPVHDLVIHPREKDLIVGTHGRSIYIADVKHIQKLTEDVLNKQLHFFEIDTIAFNKNWGKKNYRWAKLKSPEIELAYYTNSKGKVVIKILTEDGLLLNEIEDESEKGLNYVKYDLSIDSTVRDDYLDFLEGKEKTKHIKLKKADTGKYYLQPGTYNIEIEINGTIESNKLEVKAPKIKKREGKDK
ncbi:MAG: glycosyl hydrolase, partial [Ignavibacteria bacterium]|nr:glycosyl hydrolase [Ignavibacteria bacterium]